MKILRQNAVVTHAKEKDKLELWLELLPGRGEREKGKVNLWLPLGITSGFYMSQGSSINLTLIGSHMKFRGMQDGF